MGMNRVSVTNAIYWRWNQWQQQRCTCVGISISPFSIDSFMKHTNRPIHITLDSIGFTDGMHIKTNIYNFNERGMHLSYVVFVLNRGRCDGHNMTSYVKTIQKMQILQINCVQRAEKCFFSRDKKNNIFCLLFILTLYQIRTFQCPVNILINYKNKTSMVNERIRFRTAYTCGISPFLFQFR